MYPRALMLMAAMMTMACMSPEDRSTYQVGQPEDGAVSVGKADTLNRDIEKEETDEALRSRKLRRLACEAVLEQRDVRWRSSSDRSSFDNGCDDHDFRVTAFYTHKDATFRGDPMLVGMDVDVTTTAPQGYGFQTRLVRQFDPGSLNLIWSGAFLETAALPAPAGAGSIGDVIAAVDVAKGFPEDSSASAQFREISDADAELAAEWLEEELQMRVDDVLDLVLDVTAWWTIVDESGTTLGFAARVVESSEEAGEPGTSGEIYFFDATQEFVDLVDWSR